MNIKKFILKGNLVLQIFLGLVLGIIFALVYPEGAKNVDILGQLFLSALKGAAPILVFVLVISSIANHKIGQKTSINSILILYVFGTFAAALVAVIASFMFPSTISSILVTANVDTSELAPPSSFFDVIKAVLKDLVDNPVNALIRANFMGILAWAIGLGLSLRLSSDGTKKAITDIAHGVTYIVRTIIRFAPVGIFGLIASTLANTGFEALYEYLHVLLVLVGVMLFVALIVNPIIVYSKIRRNPYPLVFICLRESGVTAFFTRSSAANVPVNMNLARKLKLNEDTYSIAIPLGATINMAGAAVTITVLTLAAVNTLGIKVDMLTALLLSVLASFCACGASGVAGGSLLLIPLACSLFNIDINTAMAVVGVGMTIGVVQDSAETALNSSTDVLFTAAACIADEEKEKNKN